MIDVHCHLEQEDYDHDRDEVIKRAKEHGLKAIITCCASPFDLRKTIDIVRRYEGFVYATASIHPEFVKDFDDNVIDIFFKRVEKVQEHIIAVGETGLDYYWIKEDSWRLKQQELFRKHIKLAKKLGKPIVIHSRESHADVVEILEQEDIKKIHWHMFGARELLKRVIDNGWFISLNTIVFKSKKYRKVARDVPIDRIMLETDAPWLSLEKGKRNEPIAIIDVAKKIAEIRKTSFNEIWVQAGKNAVNFYGLNIDIKH